jgi:single stranded DNA-binding protein
LTRSGLALPEKRSVNRTGGSRVAKEAEVNDISNVTISGRVTAEPVSIAEGNGSTFSVAVNRSYKKTDSNEFQESVSFVDVTVWNGIAALCNRKLHKGNAIVVSGRLEQQRWESPDTGEKRSRLIVVASQVIGEFVFARTDQAPEPTPDAAPPGDFNEQMDLAVAAVESKPAARRRKAA